MCNEYLIKYYFECYCLFLKLNIVDYIDCDWFGMELGL